MNPPTIELDGVRLRGLRPEDAAPWYAYLSDPAVTESTSYPAMSLQAVRSMIERYSAGYAAGTSCKWAVAKQAGDELVGTCGFNELSRRQGWVELAYELAAAYWGRGFIAQAVAACLGWAFEQTEFNRVHAFVMVGNSRGPSGCWKGPVSRGRGSSARTGRVEATRGIFGSSASCGQNGSR